MLKVHLKVRDPIAALDSTSSERSAEKVEAEVRAT